MTAMNGARQEGQPSKAALAGESKANVIVVEDELALRTDVAEFLTERGHRVRCANDGHELAGLLDGGPVVLVLDVNLPGEDGYAIARRLRSEGQIGIIMVTGRGQTTERITGLRSGADAYFVKPVDLGELEAQVEALWRRLSPDAAESSGGWVLDVPGRCLIAPDGGTVALSAAEMRLLEVLGSQVGIPVSRERLEEAVYNRPWRYDSRAIDIAVSRLRAKIDRRKGFPLLSVHGVGYSFGAPLTVRGGVSGKAAKQS